MKTLKVTFLLVLLAVAATALVQAQKTDPFTLTTSSSSAGGVHSASNATQRLFACVTNLKTTNP
ncbi:MAG TPA: hypothetical protein VH597_11760 [Verrucomicrobiae bacterium]|jgi:hypothetical protein|nr:hypothetical protein [Verrucomicrobiae bacterium]